MYDAESCALLREWKPATVPCTEPIVALEFIDGKLCTCTVSGHIVVRDLESEDTEVSFARAVSYTNWLVRFIYDSLTPVYRKGKKPCFMPAYAP